MMELESANIVCPTCGNGNYMYHLIGKNVGYWDMKCLNCNSYFNFDELYKWRIEEVLKPNPITNGDKIRSMTDEELAEAFHLEGCPKGKTISDCLSDLMREPYPEECEMCWLDWLKKEVSE